MAKKKKVEPLVRAPTRSRRVARRVTTKFHKLSEEAATEKDKKKRKLLLHRLEAIRPAYQEASVVSTQLYSTSRWVVRSLRSFDALRGTCLEVGSINTQLLDLVQIQTRAIDIRSTHPRIEALDFFDLPHTERYDIVVNSLVINCVSTSDKRALMVKKLARHALDFLFIVLPRTFFMTPQQSQDEFIHAVRSHSFDLASPVHETPKLAHFCFRRQSPSRPR